MCFHMNQPIWFSFPKSPGRYYFVHLHVNISNSKIISICPKSHSRSCKDGTQNQVPLCDSTLTCHPDPKKHRSLCELNGGQACLWLHGAQGLASKLKAGAKPFWQQPF
ncbi:Hypothetical predicted protein [Marmota monax]|uniref:Uncharacterized protein n=1 Tax=Marmota monax TaxID=9995 RepID=A0A5E4BL25_MARMO|nr:hypothetical protein GHT09_001210 [Marmota monax]VTJ69352.1 Hypothetical predicted protein [Marmota monax]